MTPLQYARAGRILSYDIPLWRIVELTLWKFASIHRLPLYFVEPLPATTDRRNAWGWCDVDTKRIAIAIRFRGPFLWDKEPAPSLRIADTIAHELAHLRHPGHGRKHAKFTKKILEDICLEGVVQELAVVRAKITIDRIREVR